MDNTQRDKIDKRLKELAVAAQQEPPNTPRRQQALTKLYHAITTSGMLCRPRQGDFVNVYEEIYTEARQELMLCICRDIDKYNPEKEVMQWVNFLMRNRCFNEAIPKLIGKGSIKTVSLSDLDNLPDENCGQTTEYEELIEFVNDDPDGILKNEKMAQKPEITFQFLLSERISGKTWEKISQEVAVKLPALHAFYRRRLNKLKPKFREYL
ncbi:MAG: hypothetical protein ACP5D7_12005 [Limnospira sp.]